MRKVDKSHFYSIYFAPRGKERLLILGENIAQRHLSYSDRLIGIIGDAGSGKSLIIKGMFPGLSLSNDDDGIDSKKIMQVRKDLDLDMNFGTATYHLDMRFQMAFTQMFEIVEFVRGALSHGRRVIIEHFDLIFPALGVNADVIIGVGEEIIVTRPNLFGPHPKDIHEIVFNSVRNRRMAHSAEDITTMVIENDYDTKFKISNSDVRGGFVLNFQEKPDIDIELLENKVKDIIKQNLPISYYDEEHILVGDKIIKCAGPRIHMRRSGDIENFRILREIRYDYQLEMYALVGLVNNVDIEENDLNRIMKEVK